MTANQAPFGYVDGPTRSSVAQGGTLTVGGWATDPDTGAPVSQVQVLVDGVPVGNATLGGSRPDVAASTGRSEDLYSGWSLTFNVGSLAPGSHVLSAVATDPAGGSAALAQWGGPADETFTVSGGALAFGHFDSGDSSPLSAPYGGSLTVSGWAVDGVTVSPASKVEIRVDGTPMTSIVPSGSRPDVATYLGNAGYTNSGWSADALNRLTAANCTAHCPGNTPAQAPRLRRKSPRLADVRGRRGSADSV